MKYRAVVGLILLAGCAWSNSLYQARLLARSAAQAEHEQRPGEAQQLWGQVVVKADSAYAREPLGSRGAEALWLSGHAAARTNDCARAIPRLQSAMSAGPDAPWRQELLFELAVCEEPLGGPTAASVYTTLIASSTDPAIRRRARLRLGHALVLREQWEAALGALASDDSLPARLDRAMAFAGLGRGDEALAELSQPLVMTDTSVRWVKFVEALAGRNSASTDALLDRLMMFPNVSVEAKSSWLLEGARAALLFDPAASDRRLDRLAGRPSGPMVAEGRSLSQRESLSRSESLPQLRAAVAALAGVELQEDGLGARAVADRLRIAHEIIARSDAVTPGAPTGDLAMFGLAEVANDSLGTARLAGWFFARIEQQWPQSPYLGKALMARAPLEPDSADALLARARQMAGNPYVAAANGDVAGMVRVSQLEDSLGRYVTRMLTARPDRQ